VLPLGVGALPASFASLLASVSDAPVSRFLFSRVFNPKSSCRLFAAGPRPDAGAQARTQGIFGHRWAIGGLPNVG